jgi:acetyl-CoA carboxylase alpha subunit
VLCHNISNSDNIEEALKVLQPSSEYMLRYGIVDKIIKEPSLDKSDYLVKTLENIKKSVNQAVDELERSDIKHLQKNLREKIEECGRLGTKRKRYQTFAKRSGVAAFFQEH